MTETQRKTGTRGFGYQPERSAGYHFEVRHVASGAITVVERFDAGEAPDGPAQRSASRAKAELNAHRWRLVQSTVANDFNQRLQGSRLKTGKWLKTATPLAPHFGKELILLAWAIDDQDPTVIPRMLANWRGLAPEERWWFYTTINASTRARTSDQSYGWKAAIKIAFLEDPQDIGLESLRITSERRPEQYDEPTSSKRPARTTHDPDDDNEGPLQGRLFAEPDAPDY
jgi:hypothetical protein